MGMFDTVYLKPPYACSNCGKEIGAVQTKAFEQTLDQFRISDSISHAEDIRIVKEELYCQNCRELPAGFVYLVVNRGILAGIADRLDDAWTVLPEMNLEQMILWYHEGKPWLTSGKRVTIPCPFPMQRRQFRVRSTGLWRSIRLRSTGGAVWRRRGP